MSEALSGRVAVVTGAGAGMGRVFSLALAEAGATIVAADIDERAAEETARLVASAGGCARPARCDVSSGADASALAASVLSNEGAASILVNNAALYDLYAMAADTSDELWQRVMGVNVTGTFNMCRAFLPQMCDAGSGSIINISSVCGFVAGSGGVAYTASKHAVIGITRSVANDYGPRGVRCNAVCPGMIAVGMSMPVIEDPSLNPAALEPLQRIAARRPGKPEEVAALVVFLASDASGYMQGAALPVDGGWLIV